MLKSMMFDNLKKLNVFIDNKTHGGQNTGFKIINVETLENGDLRLWWME